MSANAALAIRSFFMGASVELIDIAVNCARRTKGPRKGIRYLLKRPDDQFKSELPARVISAATFAKKRGLVVTLLLPATAIGRV